MKLWTDTHVFSHPWEVMVEAAYRKYPNPQNPSVRTLDTLERRVNSLAGRLFSHRLFSTMWNIPTLVLKIVGSNPVMWIHEKSLCDVRRKTLTIHAKNLTLSSLFTMHEVLEYSVNPEDPNTTILQQTAEITVHGVPLLGGTLESILVNNYGPTVSKGRLGVDAVAQKIRQEIKEPS